MNARFPAPQVSETIPCARCYTAGLVQTLCKNIAPDLVAVHCDIAVQLLEKHRARGTIAREEGLTKRELARRSVYLGELTSREWDDLLIRLSDDKRLEKIAIARIRGPHRIAFRLRENPEREEE